jgi:hypothetical protein
MRFPSRVLRTLVVLVLFALAIGPASAQEAPEGPEVAACLPGGGYASGCDVDQDGDIDIFDIQRTAGRWGSSGAYTAGHTHWGETWTSAAGSHGLRLEHSASSGFTYGLYAQSASDDGIGVYARSTAASGGMAVYGRSDGVGGYGLYGATTPSSGGSVAVYGYGASSGGNAGLFQGNGPDALYAENLGSGRAIQAVASGDTAIWGRTTSGIAGVDGWNSGATGRGVSGFVSSASGDTNGVYGESASTEGQGVYGRATAASGFAYGLYGESASTSGRGVYGLATATSGSAIGVYGVTGSSSGYAGYFVGSVGVLGNLTKSSGSFKIDHPLDPANQYLYHSFVESPDMKNIYDGVAVLDARGEAMVTLPDWFEALNRDFRYQLTPIGAAMPGLYIAQEVRDNAFRIAGGAPGMKVSWQVTGIRQDAYANAHRIPVEEPKPADEQGLYLHPLELGQPAELGLGYEENFGRQGGSQ